ncbi:hypothetical protein QTG54_005919 [Skeletonema marinoi]|uniref:Uncharacterized protein n=2 Tax=Skeletonema marinoi TaxID=267567 RepID=A0AAD8YCI2_9STRA|nr:hypothetical protein QTG54_005919 [Skeletonema marinoi]
MENASDSFHHHKVKLPHVKEGYLTNNLSNCRRLHVEDMLTQFDDDRLIPFRVLISKSSENNDWTKTACKIYRQQRNEGMNLGVVTRKIMGIAYHEVYATLVPNERHRSIKESCLSKKEIDNLLLSDTGFEIRFEGMSEDFVMKFKWSDMVDSPLDLMIFGVKDTTTRSYSRLFKDKSNPIYIHFIYRELALETRGDVEATLALTSAYHLKNSVVVKEDAVKSIAKAEKEIIESMTFTGDAKKEDYFAKVDKAFEGTLRNCLVTFQDYNAILLPKELLIDFMEEAQVIFKTAWKALGNMRGIKEDHERYADLVPAKQFRVFFQLLSLARQANDKRLIHWAFVQAMASYAWGIPTKAQNIDACWGHTCSSRTRDRKMLELVDDLLSRQMKVLLCCTAVINVYDNYQRGKRLKSQRGGSSSNYLSGTHQLAIMVRPFDNSTWNDMRVELTYDEHQTLPSTSGFPAFENLDLASMDAIANALVNLDALEPQITPDFTGARVAAYGELLDITIVLCQMKRTFSVVNVCPNSGVFDDQKIDRMHRLIRSQAKTLLKGAQELQDKVTSCWNPDVGDVSLTMMLGLAGMEEDSANKCGSITLDQLYRVGVLEENADGTWKLADGWEKRRIYLFGDRKTIENMQKFSRDMANRKLTYDDATRQADVFMDAMTTVMQLPGDWHAGLAMLKSIYTLFYDGFLKPFQEALGWKRFNIEVGGCYFQACRLAGFVADELVRALMYEYASTCDDFLDDDDTSEKNHAAFLCKFAVGFKKFLHQMKTSKDELRRACALYLIMYTEFRTFVDSYRCGDAIAVLMGYNRFVPYWHALGQLKYVECVWNQNEQLLRDHDHARFEESMRNRFVRCHPPGSGKRMVAHDEWLELKNASFAGFPVVSKMESFVRQGWYVGLAEKCKRTIAECYAAKSNTGTGKSIAPSMIPEMQLIFEFIMKLDVCTTNDNRIYNSKHVYQTKSTLTTDLTRKKDAQRAKSSSDYSYNRIFSSVEQILLNVEGENEGDDNEEIDEDEVMRTVRENDDEADNNEAVAEAYDNNGRPCKYRRPHKSMLEDLKAVGWKNIKSMELKPVRAAAVQRAERLKVVKREIAKVVQAQQRMGRSEVGEEQTVLQPWKASSFSSRAIAVEARVVKPTTRSEASCSSPIILSVMTPTRRSNSGTNETQLTPNSILMCRCSK